MARKEGRHVPDCFTVDGQLEAEIKAFSKYDSICIQVMHLYMAIIPLINLPSARMHEGYNSQSCLCVYLLRLFQDQH